MKSNIFGWIFGFVLVSSVQAEIRTEREMLSLFYEKLEQAKNNAVQLIQETSDALGRIEQKNLPGGNLEAFLSERAETLKPDSPNIQQLLDFVLEKAADNDPFDQALAAYLKGLDAQQKAFNEFSLGVRSGRLSVMAPRQDAYLETFDAFSRTAERLQEEAFEIEVCFRLLQHPPQTLLEGGVEELQRELRMAQAERFWENAKATVHDQRMVCGRNLLDLPLSQLGGHPDIKDGKVFGQYTKAFVNFREASNGFYEARTAFGKAYRQYRFHQFGKEPELRSSAYDQAIDEWTKARTFLNEGSLAFASAKVHFADLPESVKTIIRAFETYNRLYFDRNLHFSREHLRPSDLAYRQLTEIRTMLPTQDPYYSYERFVAKEGSSLGFEINEDFGSRLDEYRGTFKVTNPLLRTFWSKIHNLKLDLKHLVEALKGAQWKEVPKLVEKLEVACRGGVEAHEELLFHYLPKKDILQDARTLLKVSENRPIGKFSVTLFKQGRNSINESRDGFTITSGKDLWVDIAFLVPESEPLFWGMDLSYRFTSTITVTDPQGKVTEVAKDLVFDREQGPKLKTAFRRRVDLPEFTTLGLWTVKFTPSVGPAHVRQFHRKEPKK